MLKRKTIIKKLTTIALLSLAVTSILTGCQSAEDKANNIDTESLTLEQIEQKSQEEGKIDSLGMPDTWANWIETWDKLEAKYGIKQSDTDMSSAEEISKFESEKSNPTSDIGDVGISFGPIAEQKGLTLSYKTSYWDEIPDWAKDDNGDWIVGYTGTIAVITDKTKVDEAPKTWEDIKNGDYKVVVGDVSKSTQAQNAVLSAAFAFGGDESNIQPGIDFFADLAKQGRISLGDAKPANLEKGEVEVAFLWDFNALNYANHPYAAMLTREYILSDEGQENLAKGYARPIRDVELSEEVKENLLDDNEYTNVKTISDYEAWEKTASELPQKWQQEVLIYAK